MKIDRRTASTQLIILIIGIIWAIFAFMPALSSAASNASSQSVGVTLQQSKTIWNNLKDSSAGDNLSNGVAPSTLYCYDSAGGNFDKMPADTTNGIWVNVTKVVPRGGTSAYAIKYTSIGVGGSVNFAFGFTSKILILEAPATNTDNVCIDWLGGTAVVPNTNTAGDDLIPPGTVITLDDYSVTSISAIAVSGVQTLYVRAFN
jgi:hypothetical protein